MRGIALAIAKDSTSDPAPREMRALRGVASDGARVLALINPLYLDFVDVLYCRYFADDGFVWVRHDALVVEKDAPSEGIRVDGVILEETPLTPVVEELAHAVLAQRRLGRDSALPSSVRAPFRCARRWRALPGS